MSEPSPPKETERPALLDTLSTTQMDELERQFAEDDRKGWIRLCEEYGWRPEIGESIWAWFGQRDRPDDA